MNTKARAFALLGIAVLAAAAYASMSVISIVDFVMIPRSVKGGGLAGGNVTISEAAGPGGEVIALSYSGPISGPASFTIPEGSTHGSFYSPTSPVKKDTTATVTATVVSSGSSWPVTIRVTK